MNKITVFAVGVAAGLTVGIIVGRWVAIALLLVAGALVFARLSMSDDEEPEG